MEHFDVGKALGVVWPRVEKRGLFKNDDLVLTLKEKKESFSGYEAALVKTLFFSGDTTSTARIKQHYKKNGFNPVLLIRGPLEKKKRDIGPVGGASKVSWRPSVILMLAGIALVAAGCLFGPLNIVGGIATASAVLILCVAGYVPATDYRRRVANLRVRSLDFVPQILLIFAVPLIAQRLLLGPLTIAGLVLLSLAAIRAILSAAMTRDGGERLENRRRLAAAREYFARELRSPNPALEDAWYPYLLAFGLGPNADGWFRSFGGSFSGNSDSTSSSSSSSSPTSTSSASGWTGGGGAFGGAGASGAWGAAAAGMASGVAAPSSSGSGGGGGGGSSGGGGGGGW